MVRLRERSNCFQSAMQATDMHDKKQLMFGQPTSQDRSVTRQLVFMCGCSISARRRSAASTRACRYPVPSHKLLLSRKLLTRARRSLHTTLVTCTCGICAYVRLSEIRSTRVPSESAEASAESVRTKTLSNLEVSSSQTIYRPSLATRYHHFYPNFFALLAGSPSCPRSR